LCGALEEAQLRYKTITLKVRFRDFETHTASKTLAHSTNDCRQLLETGISLLEPFLGGKKIRLVGLRAGGLVEAAGQEKLA
jgi:DNA polymerase IV (DinB-like DNA polymerase)